MAWMQYLRIIHWILAPLLTLLIDPATEHYRKPFNKIFWIFDNDEDGMIGDEPWRTLPDRCKDKFNGYWCKVRWAWRNAIHNVGWGLLGFHNSEIIREEILVGVPFEYFETGSNAFHLGICIINKNGKEKAYPEFFIGIGGIKFRMGWRSTNNRDVRVRFTIVFKYVTK